MLLGDMKVDVIEGSSSLHDQDGNLRLFRRKLLETDELDEVRPTFGTTLKVPAGMSAYHVKILFYKWLNEELRQSLVVSSGSKVDTLAVNNPNASTHCILEFGSYNQSTFELWSKAIRHILTTKREAHVNSLRSNQTREDTNSNSVATDGFAASQKCWVSPGQDSRVTLLQSEIWCNRVLSGEKEKAESEFRRIVAMEKLVAQVTHPQMALLVYEKVSRVHELFSANCRREIERLDGRETPMPTETLNFFADHLKRKYSVFLILALAYGVEEEEIREAHERMCQENAAVNAGVGGGIGEQQRPGASYGFEDPESLELYEKYRDAAFNYHKMNYGDTAAAEEEDAIMHLPVMLQVAIVRHDHEESTAMLSILNTVKARLLEHCTQENDS
ncbi:Mevalonate kinase [Phytophthora nicotianae]|nr:Mevalonate kinase [Phytophthora nicotianae]